MKNVVSLIITITCFFFTACVSETAQKGVEKYLPTPTPEKKAEIVEQIDPNDVVTVETTQPGPNIQINPVDNKKSVECTKYNPVLINLDAKQIEVKGACKQININGDRNQINAAGVSEIVFNGVGNTVQYSKYVNGKKPRISDNGEDNMAEKVAAAPATK